MLEILYLYSYVLAGRGKKNHINQAAYSINCKVMKGLECKSLDQLSREVARRKNAYSTFEPMHKVMELKGVLPPGALAE